MRGRGFCFWAVVGNAIVTGMGGLKARIRSLEYVIVGIRLACPEVGA